MDDLQEDRDLGPHLLEFESMNLHVGIRLQFITHRRVKPVQHFSTLIGWLKDEYMVVKIPMDSGLPIPLIEGERLTIRVFSGINVCSFACTVDRIFGRPLFYAHISFPTSIQGTSLRTSMRVKVGIPAKIIALGAEASATDCVLTNLSVHGARIESTTSLSTDDEAIELEFALSIPPGKQAVRIRTRANVRNVSAVPGAEAQAGSFAYGVQFIDLDAGHYTLLQNLTYEALLADRQKIV